MALWQFPIFAVPALTTSVQPLRLTADEAKAAWAKETLLNLEALSSRLAQLLPGRQGWHPDLTIWGDETSDDVQLWFEGGRVVSLQFRLDLSRLSHPFVGAICELARTNDWHLVDEAGMVVPATRAALLKAIMKSSAAKYVTDPEKFVREVAAAFDDPTKEETPLSPP